MCAPRGECFSKRKSTEVNADRRPQSTSLPIQDGFTAGRHPKANRKDLSHLHAIGHNVIFGTLAMRALRDLPGLVTPSVVSGICTLIELLNAYGVGEGTPGWEKSEIANMAIVPEDNFPPYSDEPALIKFAFESFLKTRVICSGGHAGAVGHLLTHADALTELSRMGYPEMAERGYGGYQTHAPHVITPGDACIRLT